MTAQEELYVFNKGADFWRNDIGVNVFPFDTTINKTIDGFEWKPYQDKPIPIEMHEHWKRNNKFDKGMAIILGRVWHREECKNYFLYVIDCDNQKAIEEICTQEKDGKVSKITLTDLSKDYIIEQHADDVTSCHIIGYSTKQFKTRTNNELKLEVKADSGHLINVSPSIHKNGSPWTPIENCTKLPIPSDAMEKHLDSIFRRNGGSTRNTNISREQEGEEKQKPKTIESELKLKYHFKSLKDTDEIYYWDKNKGIYLKDAEWLIKEECMKYDPESKTGNVKDVINRIIWSNYIDRGQLNSEIEWIACKNCMINLRTLETKPHSPEYMATVQIPHDYKPMTDSYEPLLSNDGTILRELNSVADYEKLCKCACPCPRIMQFLNEVMAPEDVTTVLDFMAYCLWRGFPFHKYLLFNGSGRNGKGTTIDIFKKLLGRDNISAESLERILVNRFAAAKLFGKMANVDADLSNEALKNTGLLKKLTGADDIPAEEKYRPAFHFVNHAKLIFSANQIPKTPDETDAFFSRLIIINFPNQYLGNKADPWLIRKLTTKEEMDGLFSLVVSRLPRVLDKGIYVSHSSIEDNYTKYIESSDPIRAFVEKAIIIQNNNNELKEDVYDSYRRFCINKKLGIESSYTFSRRLKNEHNLLDDKIMRNGIRGYYWVCIKLKDYKKTEEGQETL